MKVKIIFAVALMSTSIGERQQRSTVLTDESKRVLEHFDFANFDKQEALNYIDRQRYEHQIRGKRSQSDLVRSKSNQEVKGERFEEKELMNYIKTTQLFKPKLHFEVKDPESENNFYYTEPKYNFFAYGKPKRYNLRIKRGHRHTKKYKKKNKIYNEQISDDKSREKEREGEYQKRKRKKKRHYWNHWTEWSPCSVTCGRGRKIRWRKCIVKNCTTGELEMGEKICQLPACNLLSKILGF